MIVPNPYFILQCNSTMFALFCQIAREVWRDAGTMTGPGASYLVLLAVPHSGKVCRPGQLGRQIGELVDWGATEVTVGAW